MDAKKSPKHQEIALQHQTLMSEIGIGIKKLRTETNKGLVETAKSMNISRNEYSLMENGKIYFKFSTLLRVLDYHNISLSDFIKGLKE